MMEPEQEAKKEESQEDKIQEALKFISVKARQDWTQEAEDVTLGNMRALSGKSEFENVVEGKTVKRNLLKPKDLIALSKIEKEIMDEKDITDEIYLKLLCKQAKICLKDFTQEDFDNCDVVMLKIVVNACVMMTKGFRRV